MGPAYFVIAILGCADGGTACTPVATLPTRYSSADQCNAATVDALNENNAFDFPTLLAKCRKGALPAAAEQSEQRRIPPVDTRRG
jgi:acyl-CoA synthetase (AMP-forming)/AMP-acid ligase II